MYGFYIDCYGSFQDISKECKFMPFLFIPIADKTNIKLAKSEVSCSTGEDTKASMEEISHTKAAII